VNDESPRLEQLRAEARYQRTRLALYRARIYAQRPSSMTRLRELERASQGAEERLAHAVREQAESSRNAASSRNGRES